MQIPLTRIEYEHVLNTFIEAQPALLLQAGALFYSLPPTAYTVKEYRIYFHAPPEFIGKAVSVFFEHKKRSISFSAFIRQSDCGFFLSLPDIAYKYDPDIQTGKVTAQMYIQGNDPLTAQEHKDFPLDSIIHTDPQLPSFSGFLPSAYQSALPYIAEGKPAENENIFPLFLYRLHEFERHISACFDPCIGAELFILFIDSNLLICGCKDSYALSIGRRQSVRFTLHFPRRTIRILKSRSLFSHFIPKTHSAVLGFLFEDVFEEDKRFLYERVYHEKYTPSG